MTYKEKLLDPRWQKKRLRILERDDFTCAMCGDTKTTLHVHHKEYNKEPWDTDDSKLICLCKHCHLLIEVSSKQNVFIRSVLKYKLVSQDYMLSAVAKIENHFDVFFVRYDVADDSLEIMLKIDDGRISVLNNIINDEKLIDGNL